jgi:Ran GTPase-activating protein (RanGAP) involved in mRNA processing and transport
MIQKIHENKATIVKVAKTSKDGERKPLADIREVQELADCIQKSNFIKEIDIRYVSGSGLTIDGLQILTNAIRGHKGMRVLSIEGEDFGNEGAEILAGCLPPFLSTIRLSSCGIQMEGANLLFQAIRNLPTIVHINLSDNPLNHAEIFAHGLPPALTTIRLLDCGFRAEVAKDLMQAIHERPSIVHVDLSNNRLLDEFLSDVSIPRSIVSLNLSDCGFKDAGIQKLAVSLNDSGVQLRELDLSRNEFGVEGAKAIAEVVPLIPLERLNVSKNNMKDEGASAFGRAFSTKGCRISSLEMGECNIGNNGIKALAEGLRHDVNLQVLDVCGNPFSDYGLLPLRDVLYSNNRTLREIDVRSDLQLRSMGPNWIHEQIQFLVHLNNSAGRDFLDTENRPIFEWLRDCAYGEVEWQFVFDCLDKRRITE